MYFIFWECFNFAARRFFASSIWAERESWEEGVKSPLPEAEQKIHPPFPFVPSLVGQVQPESKDSL